MPVLGKKPNVLRSPCGTSASPTAARSSASLKAGSVCRKSPKAPDKPALQPDLAEIDALAEHGLDRPAAAVGGNLHHITAGAFAEAVEFEVAVIVARRLGNDAAVLHE